MLPNQLNGDPKKNGSYIKSLKMRYKIEACDESWVGCAAGDRTAYLVNVILTKDKQYVISQ